MRKRMRGAMPQHVTAGMGECGASVHAVCVCVCVCISKGCWWIDASKRVGQMHARACVGGHARTCAMHAAVHMHHSGVFDTCRSCVRLTPC
jgi:hypothetical protein